MDAEQDRVAVVRLQRFEERGGPWAINDVEVRASIRHQHPVETYGVRIEHGGRSLAYSADTAPCDTLLRLAEGADAFLCEASYMASEENPPGIHMTGRDAGEAATKAGVGRLLLTHLVHAWGSEIATFDEATSAYAGPIDVVRPGSRYEI